MDVFQHLMNNLDSEGRYFLLNAIANQLRYPNNHTHYFSCVLLYLFAEATSEYIQEQVTRVLLERLIVHRPHPWGLLITFIELIKILDTLFGLMDLLTVQQKSNESLSLLLVVSRVVLQPTFFRNDSHRFLHGPRPRIKHYRRIKT